MERSRFAHVCKEMTIILSILLIVGILALTDLYMGGQCMVDLQADSADNSAEPEIVGRIPSIPGERRLHMIAVDRSERMSARVATGDEGTIYSVPLNFAD